jgi:serine/threonine protein kinase
MTPERYKKIGEVYHRVLAMPRDARPGLLDDACAGDPELRREVESLLAANDNAGSFMDAPAMEVTARLLHEPPPDAPTRLGRYRVLGVIGRGGMGEVHLAEDTVLGRQVAIKLLRTPLTADAQTLARFEQEARAASSLNHPNIVTIHEIGDIPSGRFIAMEYVEGVPLSALVGRPMSGEKLQAIGRQLAEALAVAHGAGIVHRDLKPENVMLRPDGYVKLLDFGVARLARARTGHHDPAMTSIGVVIGTPRYMSPEQLRGEPATAASDVFALGAVLFELATGEHPSHSSAQVPSALDGLIRRMLSLDPHARPPSATVASTIRGLEATNAQSATASEATARIDAPAAERAGLRNWRNRWAALAIAIVVLAAVAALVSWVLSQRAPEHSGNTAQYRYLVGPPANAAFSPSSASLALSPDGKSLAFTASESQSAHALWVHSLESLRPARVPGVTNAAQIFWSPDSRHVAFAEPAAKFALRTVDLSRGQVRALDKAHMSGAGVGTWSSAHGILIRKDATIHQVPTDGGDPRPVTTLDAALEETEHAFPVFLPDGRHFIFLARSGRSEHDSVAYVTALGSTERTRLLKSDSQVVYASGHLLYMRESVLFAQPFDASSRRLTGQPVPVADQVERHPTARRGAFTVSQTGVLAYRQQNQMQLVWYERDGTKLNALSEPGHYRNPALSPDERTLAVEKLDVRTGDWDIWTVDLEREVWLPVTSQAAPEFMPVWSPDGQQLGYKSRGALFRQSARDSARGEQLFDGLSRSSAALHEWRHDGLIYWTLNLVPSQLSTVWQLPVGGDGKPRMILQTPSLVMYPLPSPDGRWMAYASDRSGKLQIYATRFSSGEGTFPISVDGGTEPAWRSDSRELFYLAPDRWVMAAPITGGTTFESGAPQRLFQANVLSQVFPAYARNQYVVTGNGQRFLVNQPLRELSAAAIVVVINWPAGLRDNPGT